MARLCEEEILPIALDEELIGVHAYHEKQKLLDAVKPSAQSPSDSPSSYCAGIR